MSRGYGSVQRLILSWTADHNNIWPLIYIAEKEGFESADAVRQSFVRAAWKLADDGLLDLYYLTTPTAVGIRGRPVNRRHILCAMGSTHGRIVCQCGGSLNISSSLQSMTATKLDLYRAAAARAALHVYGISSDQALLYTFSLDLVDEASGNQGLPFLRASRSSHKLCAPWPKCIRNRG